MNSQSLAVETRSAALPGWLFTFLERSPDYLVPLLILTLPFEVTQLFFPFHEIQLSRLVAGACILVLGGQLVFGVAEVRLPQRRLWLPAAAFMLYAAVSAGVTLSSDGFKTLAAMVAYALVAIAIFNWCGGQVGQTRFWTWFAVSVAVLGAIGLVEALTNHYIWNAPDDGFSRMNATFKDPNIYGRFLTCGVVTSVVVAAQSRLSWRPLQIGAIVLGAAVLPLTFSRQGWVAGGAVLLVAVLVSRNRVTALVLGALAAAVFGAVVLLDADVLLRLNVLRQILTTAHNPLFDSPMLAWINILPLDSVRHYLVAAGFQMFYDHPIFGVGFGRFPAELDGPYRAFILPGRDTLDSHTSAVTVLAETGIVGIALAAWWAFEITRGIVRVARTRPELSAYAIAAGLALVLIFLQSQFEGRLFTEPYAWLFIGAAAAANAAASRRTEVDRAS